MAGKSLDELNLKLDTLASPASTNPDPRAQEWYRFSLDIENLLATGKYTWAEDTLRGIQQTLERTHHVTAGQKQAVANIERQGEQPRRWGRRYEGYGR
jgi:hypothetical protein